jgi:hypothetical protein
MLCKIARSTGENSFPDADSISISISISQLFRMHFDNKRVIEVFSSLYCLYSLIKFMIKKVSNWCA